MGCWERELDRGSQSILTCIMLCNSEALFASRPVKISDSGVSQTWAEF